MQVLRISRTTTITRRSLKKTGLGLLTISATLGCSSQSAPQADRSRSEPTPVVAQANAKQSGNAKQSAEATSSKPRDYAVPIRTDSAGPSPSKPLSEPQMFVLDGGTTTAAEPSLGTPSIAATASDTVKKESSGFELNLAPAGPSTLTLEPPVSNVVPSEPVPNSNNVLRAPVSQESSGQVTIDAKREKVKIRFDAEASPLNGRIKAETASTHGPSNNSTNSSDPNNQELAVNDKRLPFTKLPEDDKQPKKPSSIVVASAEEKNQKIAVDWPKPKVAFFITGQQYGYLEPCGCTGLANQKGGLNRRDTLLTSILERGWDVLPIDAGNQVRRKGRQAEMKFQSTADAFKTMNYAAVSLGTDDLFLSPMQLFYALINFDSPDSSPFVSSNITIFDESAMKRYKTIRVGDMKIGITAVLGDEYQKKLIEVKNKDLQIRPAVESLRAVAAEMVKEKHDYQILLAHATLEESAKYAKEVPGFRLVITAGGFGEPEDKPSPIEGTQSVLVQCGVKGMYAGLFALYDDAKTPVRYQRIALSSQFEDSPRMLQQFVKYQDALKQVGLQELGSRPLLHSSGREFVGAEKCGDCHSKAFEIWKSTGHAKSTESLIHPPERSEIQRHFDPECLSCHVTGWNVEYYYPYVTGFTSAEATPHMMQNGCENCHGPGAAHVAAEEANKDEALLSKLREEMRLPLDKARDKCMECHDLDNSPEFHEPGAFEKYWEKVKHYGKD